jgi:hypothetical protein
MATVPNPEPDYGPVDSPEPGVPPSELPQTPDDFDQPAPMQESGVEGDVRQRA